MTIKAEALTLEDVNGESYRALLVSVTADVSASGANGLDTGTAVAGTGYYSWVIYNPTTNVVAGLLSTSATAPAMPTGYTFKTRVGWNYYWTNNAVTGFNRLLQSGMRVHYVVAASTPTPRLPVVANGTGGNPTSGPTWVAKSVSTMVPATAFAVYVILYSASGAGAAAVAPNDAYGVIASDNSPPIVNDAVTTQKYGVCAMGLESLNLYYASSASGVVLMMEGYEDNL